MATTGQNDDDLIILSDNINTSFDGNPVISQNIDFGDNNSVISFDDSTMITSDAGEKTPIEQVGTPIVSQEQEVTNQAVPETVGFTEEPTMNLVGDNQNAFMSEQDLTTPDLGTQESVESVDNSISNLFGDVNLGDSSTTNEEIVDNLNIIEPTVTNNNILDLSITQDTKEEAEDMNSILNNTIDKLKLRQSGIELQKSTKILTINDLESKMKELREQVTSLKREIVFLDDENIKIEINVGNLESMKLGKTTKGTTTKTREHNTKKLVKEVKALPQKS